jgi:hypothetical protein
MVLRLRLFGGEKERKIQELQARAEVLMRWIGTCEQAMEICAGETDEAHGYRAARHVRRSLLQADLVEHRVELDSVTAQIEALTATSTGNTARSIPLLSKRRRLVFGAIAGVLLLLAVALPIEHGLGLIPTLVATEEIVDVDPRVFGSAAYPAVEAR